MALLDHIKAEWAVLKQAPITFFLLLAFGVTSGVGIGAWHYSERLETKESEVHRYRVALGIDEASKGALIELSNQELALKAQSTVVKLRQFVSALQQKEREIRKLNEDRKIDKQQAFAQMTQARKEISESFDQNLASDAYNVENELRKRLDPSAVAHIVTVPAVIAENGSHIPVSALIRGSGFDTVFISVLADEIEQMAKLLP